MGERPNRVVEAFMKAATHNPGLIVFTLHMAEKASSSSSTASASKLRSTLTSGPAQGGDDEI